MSGGGFNYQQQSLAREMFGWNIDVDYGADGFSQAARARKINPMHDKLMSELCWDLLCVIHSLDYADSGDTDIDDYRGDVEYFKRKWLHASCEEIVEREIENIAAEFKEELATSLSINRGA